MNYDSYLAHAIEIFNDRMDAGFSGDDIILTCFMTEDQKEIFEQFCSKYFPYRLNDRYQEEGYFDFRASSFIGMDNGGKDGILLRTDIPYHPVELLHIFLHELAHIYCAHHELDGKSFYDEYCMDYAPTKQRTASSTPDMRFGGSALQRSSPLSLTITAKSSLSRRRQMYSVSSKAKSNR